MIPEIEDEAYLPFEGVLKISKLEQICDAFIMGLIVLNVIAVMLETVKSLSQQYTAFFYSFELFSVIVFTVEYIFRLWSCTRNENYKGTIKGRLKYISSPLAVVDLFAILPFYIPLLLPFDLRFIRAVRLVRLLRIFKLSRYSNAFKTLYNVLKAKKEDLFITAFLVSVLLVTSSSLMYFIENKVQPDKFSSIPASLWWGVATLSTVGYGDVYPVTAMGKILGALIALLGIGMFALPAGILGSGFVEQIQMKKTEEKRCPHCGKSLKE